MLHFVSKFLRKWCLLSLFARKFSFSIVSFISSVNVTTTPVCPLAHLRCDSTSQLHDIEKETSIKSSEHF